MGMDASILSLGTNRGQDLHPMNSTQDARFSREDEELPCEGSAALTTANRKGSGTRALKVLDGPEGWRLLWGGQVGGKRWCGLVWDGGVGVGRSGGAEVVLCGLVRFGIGG